MNESERKIGERIRARRMEIGAKSKELAKYLGVNPVTISRWEYSRCNPSLEQLGRIARFLGCTTDYLILGEGGVGNIRISNDVRRILDAIRRLLDIIGDDGK